MQPHIWISLFLFHEFLLKWVIQSLGKGNRLLSSSFEIAYFLAYILFNFILFSKSRGSPRFVLGWDQYDSGILGPFWPHLAQGAENWRGLRFCIECFTVFLFPLNCTLWNRWMNALFLHKISKTSWFIERNRGPLLHHKIGFSKESLIDF